jgi:hypothetical protein
MCAEGMVVERVGRGFLKWFGHLKRKGKNWWTKRMYNWTLPGNRRKNDQAKSGKKNSTSGK